MKKVLAAVLTLALILSVAVFSVSAAEIVETGSCGTNLSYTLTADGLLTISGTGDMEEGGFDDYHDWHDSTVTEVIIEEGVTSIGAYAFYELTELTNISIPNTVTKIGKYAFYGCDALTKVVIPASVTELGHGLFMGSGLQTAQILGPVTAIPEDAFYSCDELTALEIPASVTEIGEDAFDYLFDNSLESVYFHGTQAQWETLASGCYELRDVTVTYLSNGACSHVCAEEFPSVEPTCTQTGITAGSYCPVCDTTPVAQEVIPANGHSWGEWQIMAEPTFTESGSKTHTCTVCDEEETVDIPPLTNPFVDVQEGAFYYEAVIWAYNNGVTTGTTATTFAPDETCTRAQVVTFLWRAQGSPEPDSTTCAFTDVVTGSWYDKAVLWAAENGITTGTTETTFSPEDTVIREQFVTFLWRVVGEPEVEGDKPFSDIKSDAYYYDAVRWATANGYCTGVGGDKFSPADDCTRGQTVTFMHRMYAYCPVTAPSAIGLNARFMWLADFSEFGYQLVGTVYPEAAAGEPITWSSMDPSVATVSADGVVTRVGEGKTTIVAKCGNAVAYCTVQTPDVDMGWYVYSTANDLESMILDYRTNPYACTYVDRNGDLCAVVTIYIKYLTVGGFWNTDFYTVSYNTITGKQIEDPSDHYDKLADRYWGQSKLHYMEMSRDYLALEAYYDQMTEYYDKYGDGFVWVPVGE